MTWDRQPICGACWQAYSYGESGEIHKPYTLKEAFRDREVCCFCAGFAEQGISVRVELEKVPFPNMTVEERNRLFGEEQGRVGGG